MKQDEIIEMAVKAGIAQAVAEVNIDIMEAFAKLVAAKVRKATLEEMIYAQPTTAIKQAVEYERNACAKVCINLAADYISKTHPANEIAAKVLAIGATQILARGEA